MSASNCIHTDLIIVGTGIAGLGLATILRDTGMSIALVETKPSNNITYLDAEAKIITLTLSSKNILHSVNAWEKIKTKPLGYFRKIHVWDKNGSGQVHFDSTEIQQEIMGYIVKQIFVEQSMHTLIKNHQRLHWYQTNHITSLLTEKDKTYISLDNNQQLSAKLLVAADGQSSTIRQLANINYKIHDYHQHALVCIVETELPNQHIAKQIFLDHGPLAFLPMAESNQCAVIWSTTPTHALTLKNMNEETFNHTLAAAFDYNAGKIKLASPCKSFTLARAQTAQYCQPRLALVGDAAHTLHPLVGQGANLSLFDVACLAEIILLAMEQGKDIGAYKTLRKYERWRKAENTNLIMVSEMFKYLFEHNNSAVTLLRNIGMHMCDSMPVIKSKIMQRAMGLTGNLPTIAKCY